MKFAMVDGLPEDGFPPSGRVRLDDVTEGTITRGFNDSPKYPHHPSTTWRLVATPRMFNDDLGADKLGERLGWMNVGEVYVAEDRALEEAELIQITSLTYVGP